MENFDNEVKVRIGLINKQNFKGYAAAPIKNIYFQNNTQESQKNIFNELKEVGKKENFRVQLEQAGKLYEDIESAESSKRYMWAQDNKMIVNKNDKNHVLVSGVKPNFESELGKALEVPTIEANSVFEGGNVFLGKKPDGEKYLIIGEDAVLDMASAKFHRENIGPVKNIAHIETYRMLFAREGEYDTTTSDGRNISFEVKPFDEYEAQAKEQLSKDFDVKPENICILPQLEFHLDMFLRPLDYPYVLVNDKTMSDAVSREFGLTEEKKENGFDVFGMMFSLDKEDKHTKVIRKLKESGFTPISVAGTFGPGGSINYLNSFVNKNDDGSLSFIAMSSINADDKFKKLDSVFDKELKSKAPNIKNIYHISGGPSKENKECNNIMANIQYRKGGLHCLGCEEPDFEKWV